MEIKRIFILLVKFQIATRLIFLLYFYIYCLRYVYFYIF